ncbi:PIR Superfamily Protein [Plasmodium ovale wallikeri]|uniref:PIR Superfamily Protein n=1 Tax=Plasmodium ovale wallikeri TaxID=864142 RepID=A0A1A9AJ48_PLAOA|nr:PIR Superfamily Protein [Plasmodium ovale wallikeri]
MDCDTELYRKNYKFFNSIDEYIKYDDLAEINGTNEISGLNYDFINSFNEHKFVDFKKLCNRFVYLVDALRKRNNGSTFNADYDFDYLNYWLNARIHEIDCEIRCKKSFFQNLRAETTGIHNWGNLSRKTKKKLPSLDSNLDESEEDCESPTKMPDAKWEEEGPDEEDSKSPSDFDTQSITIGSVTTLGISFILFILYKFTSFGQFLLYRMNKNESVWENMDEEMNRSTHASEYEHINSGNSSYNVLYNSV